jgi:hypothetical protein
VSSVLGTLTIASGVKTTFSAPNNGVKAILIGNESGLTCTITMEGGGVQKTLYPGILDWFAVRRGFTGNVLVNPTSVLNNVSTWPASSLLFDAIGINDDENAGMFPVNLNRNNNIGNSVNTVGGSTTSVTNDNQPLTPSNQFREATPTGASGSTILIATDGTVTIKGDVANVLTTLLQLLPTAGAGASSVKLADATRTTEVLGALLADSTLEVTSTLFADGGINTNTIRDGTNGNTAMDLSAATGDVLFAQHPTLTNNKALRGKDSGGTARDVLYVDAADETILQMAKLNGVIILKNQDGTALATLTTGNWHIDNLGCVANNLQLPVGGFSAVNKGNTSATGTINHGLGKTPTNVLVCPSLNGSTWTFEASTFTTTQFHITINSASSTNWTAYAA